MDKKLFSVLFSTRLMAFLFIIFAAAMAAGTFIESYYNTDTARIWVYNAWWFEVIMVFFVINFVGNIQRYQLYKKEKWATLLLHLSFIFILVGAFITRYISYEGMMPIREGQSENTFYSDKAHLTAYIDGEYRGEMKRKTIEKPLILSQATNNRFSVSDRFDEVSFQIEYKEFIMNVTETIEENESGEWHLKLVESSEGSRHEHWLKDGEVQNIHNVLYAYNKPTPGAINITGSGEQYFMQSSFGGDFMRMADQFKGTVFTDSVQPLMFRSLYNIAGAQFVFPEAPVRGVKKYTSNNDWKDNQSDDALVVNVRVGEQQQELTLLGSKGKMGVPQSVSLGGLDFTLLFGSKVHELPFNIKLNKFIAERYPGTLNNYSAFESQVTVEDDKASFDARIFMNNILDHRGYRFFQASFHPDEKGTVLSVNHDFWGTWITYIGYFLLYLGLMAILFDKNTRFADLKRKLNAVKVKKGKLMLFALFASITLSAQEASAPHRAKPSLAEIEKFLEERIVSKEHAAKFGALVIQDQGGRMKPVNTFSSELLRKVSKSDHFKGFNSDQVFLSMAQYPYHWMEVPFIYLKRGNDSLRSTIGLDSKAKFASFVNFFDENGNYKLSELIDDASKSAIPNQFQKDFIEVNKRVVLLNTAFSGAILRVFPVPGDENNTWLSFPETSDSENEDIKSIRNSIPYYFQLLEQAHETNGYAKADELIEGIKKYQVKFGSSVRPSESRINAEMAYNTYDIFKRLFYLYMLAGLMMLVFTIIQIFNQRKWVGVVINVFHGIIGLFFVLHTLGLIARWYISGHAPWSDAYESMIYVAWATMFFGLAFDRKSKLTVASAAFVTSMILMIAHWSWMDPSIANLQPVLNSYWLMIHVS
ncbi:MAG: cytochrome c biogenesis protein ResB, partial [Flavobacterium sp.]